MRLPDGSPAAGVPVKIDVPTSTEKSWQATTDQEGAVFLVFNIPTDDHITVEVSIPKQLTIHKYYLDDKPLNFPFVLLFTS